MDSFGLILSAAGEIRVMLERQPSGMLLSEIENKCMTYRRLNRTDKPNVFAQLTKSGTVSEYRVLKGFGTEPDTVFHHRMHGALLKFKGFKVELVEPLNESEVKAEKPQKHQKIKQEPKNKPPQTGDRPVVDINKLSAADLKQRAAEIMMIAAQVEQQEENESLKKVVIPLQLTVAKSVCLIQQHVDGLVDAMSDLERASEALRKVVA